MKPLQLLEDSTTLKLDEAQPKPETSTKRLAQSPNTTEGRGARFHGYSAPLTAKTEAQYRVAPLQLSQEHERLKLYKTEPDVEASTTLEMVPPSKTTDGRGTRYNRYPAHQHRHRHSVRPKPEGHTTTGTLIPQPE